MLAAIISAIILSMSALALGDDVIVDMGPIFGGVVEVTPGDINDDGAIEAKDVSLLATGGEHFTYKQLAAANLYTEDDNGTTGVINIKDLIALAQCVHINGEVFTTKHAKYIKAYISPIQNTDVIDYAIVIVHGKEAVENLNT